MSNTFSPFGRIADVVPGFASSSTLSKVITDEFFSHAAKSSTSSDVAHFLLLSQYVVIAEVSNEPSAL